MASPGLIRGVFITGGEIIGLRDEESCLIHGVADQTLDTHDDHLMPHIRADLTTRGILRDPASTVKYRNESLSHLSSRDKNDHERVHQAAFDLTVSPYLTKDMAKRTGRPHPSLYTHASFTDVVRHLGEVGSAVSTLAVQRLVHTEKLPDPRPFPSNKRAFSPWSDEVWHAFQVLIRHKIQKALDDSCITPRGGVIVLQVDNRDPGVHNADEAGSAENQLYTSVFNFNRAAAVAHGVHIYIKLDQAPFTMFGPF